MILQKVLYLGPADLLGFVQERLGSEYRAVLALDEDAVAQEIADTSFVLDAYMRVRFDEPLLARAGALRAFVTATTGADHVDAAALEKRGVPLLTLRGQPVLRDLTPAAELSWLLLLACARGVRSAVDDVLAGRWDRNRHPGMMLRGRTLGIIGCGRIGQWMARYATAFGMRCLGHDPYLPEWPQGIEQTPLEGLLGESDAISLHVPLAPDTRGLIGRAELGRMKRGAILVNTSRGEIIDEAALLDALREGRLSAAGLDVLTGEPDVARHPLAQYARENANLIITPHIGGFSPDAVREGLAFCCRRIRELSHR